jgi:DNA repair protein RadA/Sms
MGQCPSCKEWNTMEEVDHVAMQKVTSTAKGVRASKVATNNVARPVSELAGVAYKTERLSTGIGEADRVLGGGLVQGGVILLAGPPGVGKSSCALYIAASVANSGKKVLYITGEETADQVATRALRIGATNKEGTLGQSLYLLSEGNLQNALQQVYDLRPELIVVDSVQTLLSEESESRVGSVGQVTEVATDFTNLAKTMNIPTILIGHVTKEGTIAGPRVVEHLVDVVLYFEASSDSPLRLLRAIKNRYGATDEIGCFQHTSEGLVPVDDPSEFFVNEHADGTTGFATSITLEGIRALPIEVQALATATRLPNPRKITQGIDHGRALMIQAVLDKYVGLNLSEMDVYVSTTGGLKLDDPSTDLSIAAAIISSKADIPIPSDAIFLGELSLTGEIRNPREREKRILEASRLAFATIYTTPGKDVPGVTNVVYVKTILELAEKIKALSKRY